MNKKLVLSVLSTAAVATLATSALAAAPKAGLYIGGNIDKFYSTDALLNLSATAKTQFQSYVSQMVAAGQTAQIVYVDATGKGANVAEILDEGYEAAKQEPLVAADFEDSYTEIKADGTTAGTVDPQEDLGGTPTGELKVEGVSAINLKNAVITFSKEADVATVTTTEIKAYVNGSATPATITVTPAVDKKSATVAFNTALNQSDVVKFVVDGVKDAAGKAAPKFEQTVTVTDVASPVASRAEVINNKKVKLFFSEPVNWDTAGIYKTTDVTNSNGVLKVDGALSFAKFTAVPGENAVVVDFFNALTNGQHTIEVSEVKDYAGFKVASKSFTVTAEADVTAPVASKVEAKGTNKVVLTFGEELKDAGGNAPTGTFSVKEVGNATDLYTGGSAALTTDKKGIELTLGTPFTAAASLGFTVTYKNVEDVAGNKVTTDATLNGTLGDDTVKPTVTSYGILANNKLEVVFSEPVDHSAATVKLYKKGETTPVATYGTGQFAAAASAKANAYDLTLAYLSGKDAADYELTIEGVKDTSARKNTIDLAKLSFTSKDDLAPTVTAATMIADTADNDKIEVVFSEAMNTTDLANVANYFVGTGSAGVALSTVTGAKVDSISADGKKVVLLVPDADNSNTTTGTTFTAAVNRIAAPGLRDASGKFVSNATIASPATVAAGYTAMTANDISVEATGKNTIVVKALNGFSFSAADANSFKFYDSTATATNDLGVVAAQISADGKSITLTTSVPVDADATFNSIVNSGSSDANAVKLYVTGTGVKDQNGQALAFVAGSAKTVADKIVATGTTTTVGTGATANKITFSFDEAVSLAAASNDVLATGIELLNGSTALNPVTDYTAAISGGKVVVTVIKNGVNNANISATLKTPAYLADAAGNAVVPAAKADLTGVTEKVAPTVTAATEDSTTQVTLTFSEALDPATVVLANFTGTATPSAVSYDAATKSVVVTVGTMSGTETIVVGTGVTDAAGNPIAATTLTRGTDF